MKWSFQIVPHEEEIESHGKTLLIGREKTPAIAEGHPLQREREKEVGFGNENTKRAPSFSPVGHLSN
jgi:hypothetical protein